MDFLKTLAAAKRRMVLLALVLTAAIVVTGLISCWPLEGNERHPDRKFRSLSVTYRGRTNHTNIVLEAKNFGTDKVILLIVVLEYRDRIDGVIHKGYSPHFSDTKLSRSTLQINCEAPTNHFQWRASVRGYTHRQEMFAFRHDNIVRAINPRLPKWLQLREWGLSWRSAETDWFPGQEMSENSNLVTDPPFAGARH